VWKVPVAQIFVYSGDFVSCRTPSMEWRHASEVSARKRCAKHPCKVLAITGGLIYASSSRADFLVSSASWLAVVANGALAVKFSSTCLVRTYSRFSRSLRTTALYTALYWHYGNVNTCTSYSERRYVSSDRSARLLSFPTIRQPQKNLS
jgi:hypothetical protein